MNNQQIAHAWAHQSKSSGKGSNFYFEGPRLYSYGSHYLAGMIHETKHVRVYLLNSEKYSSSTARHVAIANHAIPYTHVSLGNHWSVPHPESLRDVRNYQHLVRAVKQGYEAAIKSMGSDKIITRSHWAQKAGDSLASFCVVAGRKINIADQKAILHLKAKARERIMYRRLVESDPKRQAKLEKTRAEKERVAKQKGEAFLKEARENALQWMKGDVKHASDYFAAEIGDLLRVRNTTGEGGGIGYYVQTSRSCEVPLEDVKRIIPEYLRDRARGGCNYQREGILVKIGEYTINRVEEDGTLIVGCHRFKPEIIDMFLEINKDALAA